MQLIAPAFHPVGAGVGGVFPLVTPPDIVAPPLHLADEILPTHTGFHGLPDVVHEAEFPALPLPGGTVFSGGHLLPALLIGRQNREVVRHADLVADLPELAEGVGVLAELPACLKADGIDDEVGVDMPGIAVGGNLHLMPRPGLRRKLQSDFVSLFIGDVLPWRKGLDILVKVDAVQLVVGGLGGEKFREGILSVAVEAGHIPAPGFRVGGFVHPLTVAHDGFHGTDMLLGFFDIGHSRHLLPPMRTSSS